MAQQIIFSCDLPEHAKKPCVEKTNGKVAEREHDWEGKTYSLDSCDDGDAIIRAKIAEVRRIYEDAMREILKPAIDAGRVKDTPIPEPEPDFSEMVEKYGSALDLAMKDFYWREYPDREQPNPNRKRVPVKFRQLFFDKEDSWEGWEIGDPIPAGWEYDGKTCKYVGLPEAAEQQQDQAAA